MVLLGISLFVSMSCLFVSVCGHQQYHLKFGMYERPPGYFKKDSANDTLFEGVWVDAVEWLSLRSKFSYTIIPMGKDFGKPITLLNGTQAWSGAVGRILKEDFDIMAPPTAFTFERNQAVDCVGMAGTEDSALLTPALKEQSTLLSTIKPFQLHVWVMIIITLLAVAFCFTATSSFGVGILLKKKNHLLISLGDHIFYALGTLVNQVGALTIRRYRFRLSFRISCAVWCLFAVVISNLYSGTLTSYITARKMMSPPREAFDVVEQGVLDYLMLDDGIGRGIVMNAKTGMMKKMGDLFRQYPERFVSRETAFLKVASGCCAYTDLLSYLEYRSVQDFQETGKCRVHIGDEAIKGYGFVGLLIRKGDPRRDEINKRLLELYQTGLLDHWRKKYTPRDASLCRKKDKKLKKLRRVNLQDMASAFCVLGIGLVATFTAYVTELAHHRFYRCRRLSPLAARGRERRTDKNENNDRTHPGLGKKEERPQQNVEEVADITIYHEF